MNGTSIQSGDASDPGVADGLRNPPIVGCSRVIKGLLYHKSPSK